jgi:hypothetical protein
MQGDLHTEAIHVDYEESLTRIAYDLFDEMYTKCRKAARYGQMSLKIRLSDLPTYHWIPTNTKEYVKVRLMNLLISSHLFASMADDLYELSWKEQLGPTILLTTRDLIAAGYPVNEAQFGKMLKALQCAKVEETLQAQLLWIKLKFPL